MHGDDDADGDGEEEAVRQRHRGEHRDRERHGGRQHLGSDDATNDHELVADDQGDKVSSTPGHGAETVGDRRQTGVAAGGLLWRSVSRP